MNDAHPDQRRPLTIEFDGPEADPDVIDPRSVFDVAARFVDLVQRVAEKTKGEPVRLRGFEVRDKCTQIVFNCDAPPERLAFVSERVLAVARGEARIPGTARAAGAFARALREADPRLRIAQRGRSGDLRVIREPLKAPTPAHRFHEVDEVRASVIKVGGRNPPRVQLDMPDEPRLRWLAVSSEDVVREMAALLYRQIDADVRIHREADGRFISGRVLAYRPVRRASVGEMRAWYREHLAHWDDVDDVEGALGRGPSEEDEGA